MSASAATADAGNLTLTHHLAAFASGMEPEQLTPAARAHVSALLVDAVACAFTGDAAEETPQLDATAAALAPTGRASVLAGGETTSVVGAVLRNGWLITATTVCDVYIPSHCHITPVVVPSALAVAEDRGATGAELFSALAAGFETTVRVGAALDYPTFRSRGWHSPGVIGPFGAAAAVGRLMGLGTDAMVDAFGLAGSQSAGTFGSWGTPTVKFHQARGGVSGLLAGLLAAEGFRSSPDFLGHPDGGLLTTYTGGGHPAAITDGLGERWELERIALRRWPGGTQLQPILTGLHRLHHGHRPAWEEIDTIAVHLDPTVRDQFAPFAEPRGTFEALLSVPFVASVMVRDGDLWLDQIGPDHYEDAELRAFMREHVRIEIDDDLTRESCRVVLHRRDGTEATVEVLAARGTPDDPLTDEELDAKFHRCVDPHVGPDVAARLLADLRGLQELTDLGGTFAALRGESGRRRP